MNVLSCMICTPHQILFGDQMGKNEVGEHIARMGKGEVHKGFWCGNMRERNHLEDPDVDGRIII